MSEEYLTADKLIEKQKKERKESEEIWEREKKSLELFQTLRANARKSRILGVMAMHPQMSVEDADAFINDMDTELYNDWIHQQRARNTEKEEHEEWLEKHSPKKEEYD